MYKMHAIYNIADEKVLLKDSLFCWCGTIKVKEGKVDYVELSDGEKDFRIRGELVTKELIKTLALDSAWDSGIDDDLLCEGIEVELRYCEKFPESKPNIDECIFELWMNR